MKIGIITKIGKNYGAILQAYALKKKLYDLGHEAHIIKYTPEISVKSYRVCKFPWRFRGALANIKSAIHYKSHKKSTKRFLKFREKYFDFVGDYNNDVEIEENPPQCDIYITGSDQVWNPVISFDKAFYCCFADKYTNSKKASYAASIGLREIPEHFREDFKLRVSGFDYISVREEQAVKILSEMGISANLAPDPTLLLDKKDWHSISKSVIDSPYILCYFVSVPKGIDSIVKEIKKRLGLKVVNLMTTEESAKIGDVRIRDAGPEEFLGLFEGASFVITSSFHGTVFSLINQKPFVVTLYSQTSSRVTDLLYKFGLERRILDTHCDNLEPYFDKVIYTQSFCDKLSELRCQGVEILKEITGDK